MKKLLYSECIFLMKVGSILGASSCPQRTHCRAPDEHISGACQRISPTGLSDPQQTHCGAHGEGLEQHGPKATPAMNSKKAVMYKAQPSLKA